MFGTILISIATLMSLYVFWRAGSVPFIARHVPRTLLFGAGFVLWLILILGRRYGHDGAGTLAAALEFIGMNWLAVLFLLFISLLAMDLITGFGLFLPRLSPWLRGLALAAGLLLAVMALFQGLRSPVIVNYEVRLPGLPKQADGLVIAAVSDLHLGSMIGESWLASRVAQIKAQKPDLVLLLGDIFEGHGRPPAEMLTAMKGLLFAPLGAWVVLGNHEYFRGTDNGIDLMEKAGFKVLRNRWVEVRPGLILAGVEDLTSYRRSGRTGDPVMQTLADRPAWPTIFLSHTPWEVDKAAALGVSLMLSGHTHGGQLWPFGLLSRLRYKYVGGRYEIGRMSLIVTRGAGAWGPRMRLWRPGEIIRVTLRAGD